MMDPALRQSMKELEIQAIRLVNNRFMGEWASNMRGQGLEFRDLREYVPGDDVRRLDWKATARSGRPQLRQFTEDRQQNIWLALDVSASMTGRKAELAARMLAVLGWAAVKQGDKFGLMGFSDRLELHRTPARGEAQLWTALEDALEFKPESRLTSLNPVAEFFLKRVSGHATVIILSDFSAALDGRLLRALSGRHEVLAFHLSDPLEEGHGDGGLSLVEDSESGELAWVDLSQARARSNLKASALADREQIRLELRKAGFWYSHFTAGDDFLPPLMEFFHRRMEVLGA